MLEPDLGNDHDAVQTCPDQQTYWLKTIIEKFRKYKTNFFGPADLEERKQRMLEYTVKPSHKFVLAKYTDGLYRPGCVAGRSKKRQLFIVSFYHNKKCLYVKPSDILFKHGNLLNLKVTFNQQGRQIKGIVYGNNSPANKGFPSMFYIKKKHRWHKVPFKMIFLTRKQFNKFKFYAKPPDQKSKCSVMQDYDQNQVVTVEGLNLPEEVDLKEINDDFEMS